MTSSFIKDHSFAIASMTTVRNVILSGFALCKQSFRAEKEWKNVATVFPVVEINGTRNH